ncbi:MAG: sialidase, partial [Gemmatimonadales bacterium]|nr:sialidase [Gemmatimonadales bacterium]MBT3773336.1 sialidase [Gemmatimonadales bacterium]MBT3958881.1 sialidase [Gemmatimonadales bacterium]MBT5046087.1 sialidase [Gemmatimonadales bacterium]MBT6375901.1 sialidase [Gemmatimonadales bacterium]
MRPTLRALSSLPLILTLAVPAAAQQIPTDALSQLSFRHIGPVGNRTTSIAGVEGDRFTYYAGAATGGVWKTEDAGIHWKPVFDDQPVHAIGALAVSSSDPAIVWVGTGETSIRSNVSLGNGVWKSTDAGETWAHMGLEGTGRIGKVLIHPSDPDIVYVASLGHSHGPSA